MVEPCVQALNELTGELTRQRALTRPKKFAFRSSSRLAPPSLNTPQAGEAEGQTHSSTGSPPPQESVSTRATADVGEEAGFKDLRDQTLCSTAPSQGDDMADFSLSNLTNCIIFMPHPLRALRAHNLKHCQVFAGPVTGSALLYDCSGCSFSLAAQQLRIHDASDCDFYLLARSTPILENSTRVRFAPYNFVYPQLEEQLKEYLDTPTNFWDCVQDFSWPRPSQPSPNWSVLAEEERRAPTGPPSSQ